MKGVIDNIDVRLVTIEKEVLHWFFWKKIKRIPAWELLEDFEFFGQVVKAGRITDFGSIPKFAKWFVDPVGILRPAFLIHDDLYNHLGKVVINGNEVKVTRLESDLRFLDIMVYIGTSLIKRNAVFQAVRLGGWVGWNRKKKELAES